MGRTASRQREHCPRSLLICVGCLRRLAVAFCCVWNYLDYMDGDKHFTAIIGGGGCLFKNLVTAVCVVQKMSATPVTAILSIFFIRYEIFIRATVCRHVYAISRRRRDWARSEVCGQSGWS